MSVIKMKDITKRYVLGETTVNALNKINLTIENNMKYAVIGCSGSGKTTLANIIGCLDKPTDGKIWFHKIELNSASSSTLCTIRRKHIGFIYQNFYLNPILTALDNVKIALTIQGIEKNNSQKAAKEMLEQVGLGKRLHHYPNQLSGGQRQRVSIARALVKKPDLIIADEPTGNLDSKTSNLIASLIFKLSESIKASVVLITHDMEITKAVDQVIKIKDGYVI